VRKVRILFVCTGNICRSPTAEGVFRHFVKEAGLATDVTSDSAGTHGYHVGEAPDPRTQRAAESRGYDLAALRARQVSRNDFEDFDYVLAMDQANLLALQHFCPAQHSGKLRLFMEFGGDPAVREVPDPYYGGAQGFERVLDLVERASRGLIKHIQGK
jgi:low molecular weight protein-tyrosine phosphatase